MGRSYTYRVNREALKNRTQQTGSPCAVCGGAFLWDVIWYHSKAFTAGHIIPVAEGGSDDIENLRPEHHGCNTSAGARLGLAIAARTGRPSNVGIRRADLPTAVTDPKSQEWP